MEQLLDRCPASGRARAGGTGYPAGAHRVRRGRRNHLAGLAAEEQVAALYRRGGARIRARRLRTPQGELDLIVDDGASMIFVEVKQTRGQAGPESPVSARQWTRIAHAATHFMAQCAGSAEAAMEWRFDVAVVRGDGAIEVYENARTFEDCEIM